MLTYEQQYELLKALKVPNLDSSEDTSGWSDSTGWHLCEVVADMTRQAQSNTVQSSPFIGTSLDESAGLISVHAYAAMPDFSRKYIFVGLPKIDGTPNADNLKELFLSTLQSKCGSQLTSSSTDSYALPQTVHQFCMVNSLGWSLRYRTQMHLSSLPSTAQHTGCSWL